MKPYIIYADFFSNYYFFISLFFTNFKKINETFKKKVLEPTFYV